jgi:para-aminobenzoate synthetase/4-amino-4-deoxychorismate lyase
VIPSNDRPDPAEGIFETLLVVRGEPVEMEAHLARLQASLAEIYAAELPPGVAERVRAAAAELELGRLRLTAVPNGSRLDLHVLARPVDHELVFPSAPKGAELRRANRPGGHGPHKWVDRTGMDHPDAGPGQLICDGEELLEAGWANLFAMRRQTLWTPAADGRILPGMARAAVLEIARSEGLDVREEPLTEGDLLESDEVFLTNSVRGVEAAAALNGVSLAGLGPVSHRLAAALRRRWGLASAADGLPAPATAPQPDQLFR